MSFTPDNELERCLIDAQEGRLPIDAFIAQLLEASLFVPSRTPVGLSGQGLQPLFYEREGRSMVVVFTATQRMGKSFTEHAKYCLQIQGRDLLQGIPEGYGMVINPGSTFGLELPAEGLLRLKNEARAASKK